MSRFFQEIELVAQRSSAKQVSTPRHLYPCTLLPHSPRPGFYHQNFVFRLSRHIIFSNNPEKKLHMDSFRLRQESLGLAM